MFITFQVELPISIVVIWILAKCASIVRIIVNVVKRNHTEKQLLTKPKLLSYYWLANVNDTKLRVGGGIPPFCVVYS